MVLENLLIAEQKNIDAAIVAGVPKNGRAHPASRRQSKKSRVKILYIIDHIHGFGGTERHLYNVVQHLDKEKFSCYLLVMDAVPSVVRLYEEAGCHVLPHRLDKIYNWQAMRIGREVIRFIKEEHIDVVQTFHFGSDTFGSIVSRLAGVPILISSRRDLGSYRTGYVKLIDRLTQRLFHRYLSVCRAVSDTLVDDGVSKNRITEIPNGVDLSKWQATDEKSRGEARRRLNIEPEVFVIGNLSHFRPEKGHTIFFEAIRRVAPQISKLKVFALGAGRQPMLQMIEHLIQQDPILHKIVTIDKVDDVSHFLPAFDVACLTPTMNEGFSNALIEEMAAGMPVIATDVGGNAEAVEHGVSGLIVPPKNAGAIAEALLKLYEQPELRRAMGKAARTRVEKFFTLDKMINQMERFYLSVLTGKAK